MTAQPAPRLSDGQHAVLTALVDVYVPSLRVASDPDGFWARSASSLGVDRQVAESLDAVPERQRAGLIAILDALGAQGFLAASPERREAIVRAFESSPPPVSFGMRFYSTQTRLLNYGSPAAVDDPNLVTYGAPQRPPTALRNPNWETLGYPGPISVPPRRPKQIRPLVPRGDSLTLSADVCVVGSGAGGAVVADRLAAAGHRVVVLEMGRYYSASDFQQLELWSYRNLWYRGGATPTDDGNVTLLAGSTLGGGTEINWMNCIRTPDLVRRDWVQRFGLDGVDGPDYDRHLDAVERRIMANSQTAYFNDANLRMREGSQALGYLTTQTRVNWDPDLFDPLFAGYTGLGDQTGGKRTARRAFLLDAYRNGAHVVVGCRVERIRVERGRAVGVEGTYTGPDGRRARVVVDAPQVVVSCGSLESPALLLRSGIGGPAVGRVLRVQPGGAVYGIYPERQRSWWGSPMTANCQEFVDTGDGYGFYMEIPAFAPGFYAAVIPWASGREHKELMTRVPHISTFIWFLRDRGHGRVTVDGEGNAVHTYDLVDPVDQKNFRHATAEAVRIHRAAGAEEVFVGLSNGIVRWRRGEDLDAYLARVAELPLAGGAQPIISAHQMCSCLMGADPATSVADTDGTLRDVEGVWVADGSACPTSLGANPMVTIMALAERTAERLERRLGRPVDRSAPPLADLVPRLVTDAMRGMAGLMTLPLQAMTWGPRLLGRAMGGRPCEPCGDARNDTLGAARSRGGAPNGPSKGDPDAQ